MKIYNKIAKTKGNLKLGSPLKTHKMKIFQTTEQFKTNCHIPAFVTIYFDQNCD